MSLFAWTQDVPIDQPAYRDVIARMGAAEMPGLLVHLAIQDEQGRLRYLDVWESEQACDAAFAAVVHPAVHGMLVERGIEVAGEPARNPLTVINVRYADGRSVTG